MCALGVRAVVVALVVVLTGWLCHVACVAVPVVQALLSMSQVEAEEVHFAVGQALVEAGSGLLPRFKDAPLGFGRAKEGEEEGGADSDAGHRQPHDHPTSRVGDQAGITSHGGAHSGGHVADDDRTSARGASIGAAQPG